MTNIHHPYSLLIIAFLTIIAFVSCASSNKEAMVTLQIPTELSRNDGKPLVSARLQNINVAPFSTSAMRPSWVVNRMNQWNFELFYKNELNRFLHSRGIFEETKKSFINVRVELLSCEDKIPSQFSELVEVIIKYEFRSNDGIMILEETITSYGTDDTWLGSTRVYNTLKKVFNNNIAMLAEIIQDKLPAQWDKITAKKIQDISVSKQKVSPIKQKALPISKLLIGKVISRNDEVIELDLGSGKGIKVGNTGRVYYKIAIEGHERSIYVANFTITHISQKSCMAKIEEKTGDVRVGYLAEIKLK